MSELEMKASEIELFDNVLVTAQRLLKAEKDKSKITPSFIFEKVKLALAMFSGENSVSIDETLVVKELIQRFSHWMGKSTTIKDNQGHIEWINSSRKNNWNYWRRYRDYLESKLSDKVVESLDEDTDSILGLLEDPQRNGNWDRRGLVVGHVQSGKTSNYSGLICKAADAGYKIIIVLSGMHNNLRSQTQIRLEESFLGYETNIDRDPGKPIGVAEFGDDLKTNSATTRAENGDFNKTIARHFHGISPEERPWLFVVKKQKKVLSSLLQWIQTRVADSVDTNDGRKLVTKLPLLVIDDEADNASVDTGEQLFTSEDIPDDEHQPKAINGLIRELLHAFSRKAYVGYTATPFANIFIHHKGATSKEGPDLFPRSFIINLAAPSNYIGPNKLFGTLTKEGRIGGLPLTRDILDNYDALTDSGWMPPKHNKNHVPTFNGQEIIPPSLIESIYAFIITCCVRELRGQKSSHCSMLIHVTRYVDVQNHVKNQVAEAIKKIRQKITRGTDAFHTIQQIQKLWETDFLPTHREVTEILSADELSESMPSWDEILKILPDILSDIEVRSINGTAKDVLDYATPGASLKVIAIGGDKLARGLTLEGLCVSYFVRTTKMYDTLMQMGRWFGYRPGYIDLCRLYTSPDLIDWFGHIADASEELRDEFDYMAKAGLTPEEYGFKVKSHEVLTVTSPLKMRNSESLSFTYSGSCPQTILFHRDEKIQSNNLLATDNLFTSIGTPTIVSPEYNRNEIIQKWKRSYLWKDINASNVLSFLNSYITHPDAESARSQILGEFIEKMNDIGHLKKWNIALLAEGDGVGEPYLFTNNIKISSFPMRTPKSPKNPSTSHTSKFAIGVLTDPSDEGIDLDNESWNEALRITKSTWSPNEARGRREEPTMPSGKGIRRAREIIGQHVNKGLLLLYPLSPYVGKEKIPENLIIQNWDKPIMGFAIAFPTSDTGVRVKYEVNLLYWRQEYGPSE